MSYTRTATITLKKDGVEYELELSKEKGNITIESVTILQGGVQKTETDIDPEEFETKLKDFEWETIKEVFE